MSKAQLKLLDPGGKQPVFELGKDEVMIGRLSDSDIVITNPYVSRKHAKIIRRSDTYFVCDINSTHGTFVNGSRVSEQRLLPGDRISLGHDQVQLLFQGEDQGTEPQKTRMSQGDMEKSVMQLTSVIPMPHTEASYLEKISHLLDFQVHWEQSFSPEDTFRQIIDAALQLSGAERGYILLKEDPSFKFVVGMNGNGDLLKEHDFRTSQTVVQEVVSGGQPVLMTQNIDQAFAQQQSILAMDLRAVACMPLRWISPESEKPDVRGILYLDSTKTMHALTGLDQKILNKLADEAANVFEKLEMIQAFEERKAYEKELALARETQTTLLPAELPKIPGFELAAFSQPTRHVGGDFYDFLPREASAVTGVLADVSGKGISAALLSSLVQGALQVECRSGKSLNEAVQLVNLYLCEKSRSNRFVTLFLFSIAESGKGEFISAGHNPAYLFRAADGAIEELSAQGLILGAFNFATYAAAPMEMSSDDILVVYTDGITEAMNPHDEMFGEDRLVTLIRENSRKGCHELERIILEAIQDFTEGQAQTDDMTMVIVQMR
jgi:serine phosphatase RsbU (regulator of sigma subunit)